jgi:hypothetical protein
MARGDEPQYASHPVRRPTRVRPTAEISVMLAVRAVQMKEVAVVAGLLMFLEQEIEFALVKRPEPIIPAYRM